jgi:DNA repair exonuclease SbcCD nuclease subunit
MVKKIVHLSDLHVRTFKRHLEYQEVSVDLFKSLKKVLNGYNREEIRIVIVGDLVHQKITISNEQIMFLSWFLQRCAKIAPTVVVAGNHDLLENNQDRMDSLTPIIKLLNNSDINYLKESKCYEDDNIVWCNYSIFEGNKRPDIEKAREEFGDKTYVGLLHAPMVGATTNIGYEFEDGVEAEYFDGCDVVMLGDIHKRQDIKHDSIPIMYPGSLIQQDFGESISNHGYLLWNIEDLTFEEKNIDTQYGFYKFKISSMEDIEDNNEQLLNP